MFDVNAFVGNPTLIELESLKKSDIIEICKHYELECKVSMVKSTLINIIAQHLVDEQIGGQEFKNYLENVGQEQLIKLKELELKTKEIELKSRELELNHVWKQNQLAFEKEKLASSSEISVNKFDPSRVSRLVPSFKEEDIDQYFSHFEKVAQNLEWPRECWTSLLQTVFVGKARQAYNDLSSEHSKDYDKVKHTVLKVYELVPEAYRQKFRNCKMTEGQTHVEFMRIKERLLDKWVTAKNANNDYDELRQLMLLEELKHCVHPSIKLFLDEQDVYDVYNAAEKADFYTLTHKLSNPAGKTQATYGNHYQSYRGYSGRGQTGQNHGFTEDRRMNFNEKYCDYCKRYGHMESYCFKKSRSHDTGKQSFTTPTQCAVETRARHGADTLITPESGTVAGKDSTSSHSKNIVAKSVNEFKPFISDGFVSINGINKTKIRILRDTGASRSLFLRGVIDLPDETYTGQNALIQGVDMTCISIPLHNINIECGLVNGKVVVGVMPGLPCEGISLLLGNDLAGGKVQPDPVVTNKPETESITVVTRTAHKRAEQTENCKNAYNLENTFLNGIDDDTVYPIACDKSSLIEEQNSDITLKSCMEEAVALDDIKEHDICYYMNDGLLMRKYRPPEAKLDEDWRVAHQIVLPIKYHGEVLKLAHDLPMSGHLGISKTRDRILAHFYWPKIRKSVAEYCKTCHICQVVGKPNQTIKRAPLRPIPAFEEPFSKVIIDCVGPLPKTKSGNQYLLTIMCSTTRFPEAIPLRNIKAKQIVSHLIKFFTLVGLPQVISSDQGSNFMSNIFKQVVQQLGIKHCVSSAYHPETQGALERFHGTLKTMLKAYCLDNEKHWDEGVHLLLFAARESVQESLGFSPFELIFGHSVRGPLKLLKEQWLTDEQPSNLLTYVCRFREKLTHACEIAMSNLKQAQGQMKARYDRNTELRKFEPGDEVLLFLPVPGHPLTAKYYGPYEVEKMENELNYVVKTPDRRKPRQRCHINMMKQYHKRDKVHVQLNGAVDVVNAVIDVPEPDSHEDVGTPMKLNNSDILSRINNKLAHLNTRQIGELSHEIKNHAKIFQDVPGQTTVIYHDVDIGDAQPIKQHPYRVNPIKLKAMREEIQYMLKHDIIEPCISDFSSPSMLVPKPDKSYRFITDYRRINAVTKKDSFPIPRIEDCIDKIGKAKFVSKIDMLKGFWQVALTDRAKQISAFVTPDGQYRYRRMAFGMVNSSATFQRLVNIVISGLEGCQAYIDDLIIYSDTWEEHMIRIRALFKRLADANLTVNLEKSDFCKATVEYLGHEIGQGQVKPVRAKIDAIVNYSEPKDKKSLMRYLWAVGYYRRFCVNFSTITYPLTELLAKNVKYIWSEECSNAFNKIKRLLTTSPVLITADYTEQFTLFVDASDVGAGAVITQRGNDETDHPVSFYSKKFDKHQRNYSTIEKECLSLILALQHFDVYINVTLHPVIIYTDHNPLTFINRMKNSNQKILRWSLIMQAYNIDIRHIKGKHNVIADALSRAI